MKKIGLRTIKTGIAVFWATLAGKYGIIETPVYTVSVCIFSIKNTMKSSVSEARSRIIGTLLGGLVGYVFALFIKGNIISSSLGVIFIIHLCTLIGISDSAGIASVTFAAIIIGVGKNNPLHYSIMRTFDTMVGILIALLVNYGISRKKYLKYLFNSFNLTHNDCISLVSTMLEKKDFSLYSIYKNEFYNLENYYTQLIDEVTYSNKDIDLKQIHLYFYICEQILHHTHGLYLLEKVTSKENTTCYGSIFNYHINSISFLLSCSANKNLNFDNVFKK